MSCEEEDPRAGPDGGSAFTMLADAGAWEDVFADADFLDGDEEEKEVAAAQKRI